MIMILGYIFAAVLAIIALWIVYHIVRGLVIGVDLMRWKMIGINWDQVRATPNYKRELVKMFFSCWGECIGFNGGITYSRNGRKWTGFGTGR
jgi:hypothetical protein